MQDESNKMNNRRCSRVRKKATTVMLALILSGVAQFTASAQTITSASLRSAALAQSFDLMAPDSLAFAFAETTEFNIPQTIAPQRTDGMHLAEKLLGFQVFVQGVLMPIFSIEASAATDGKLRIGVYLPPNTPLVFNSPSLEIKRDNGAGGTQLIARGTTWVLKVSPNLFVRDGYISTPLVSLNGVTWMKGRAKITDTEEAFSIGGTPNSYSSTQETRVVIFGTGLRNAADTELSNNPPGFRNVAESFEVIATYLRYINGNSAGFQQIRLPIDYIGPVKDASLPGIDQIVFRLRAELKECLIQIPGETLGEVEITLKSIETLESSEVSGSPTYRTRVYIKP